MSGAGGGDGGGAADWTVMVPPSRDGAAFCSVPLTESGAPLSSVRPLDEVG